jgi:ABC-type dipeptide/oligopeptide/nickel transport system permease subunit
MKDIIMKVYKNRFVRGFIGIFITLGIMTKKIWMHKKGRIGLILLVFVSLIAIFAPIIAPYDPYDVLQRGERGVAPSFEHLLGTTSFGQDIFSMLIYGARVSMSIGIITATLISFTGAIIGIAAGYLGKLTDVVIMRIVDVMLVIPTLPIVIVLTNLFGKSYPMLILIFTIFGWAGLSRVVRSQVLTIKNTNYVKSTELFGASKWYVMIKHILPGVSNQLIMNTAMTAAGVMIAEAGLSFLGLGNTEFISWGKMLAEAQSNGAFLLGYWWWIIAPGIGIFLSVSAFMLIGYSLEEIFNPRMSSSNSQYRIFKTLSGTYIKELFEQMESVDAVGGEVNE